jgi:hypothetical protein
VAPRVQAVRSSTRIIFQAILALCIAIAIVSSNISASKKGGVEYMYTWAAFG